MLSSTKTEESDMSVSHTCYPVMYGDLKPSEVLDEMLTLAEHALGFADEQDEVAASELHVGVMQDPEFSDMAWITIGPDAYEGEDGGVRQAMDVRPFREAFFAED
jgi:hypothetical protein